MNNMRRNIYFKSQRIMKALGEHPNISKRVTDIIDRYDELVRRTNIRSRFTSREWTVLKAATADWEPTAAAIFDLPNQVFLWGQRNVQQVGPLLNKLRTLTPGEMIALADAIEAARKGDDGGTV